MRRRAPWPWEPAEPERDLPPFNPASIVMLPPAGPLPSSTVSRGLHDVGDLRRGRDALVEDLRNEGWSYTDAYERAQGVIDGIARDPNSAY